MNKGKGSFKVLHYMSLIYVVVFGLFTIIGSGCGGGGGDGGGGDSSRAINYTGLTGPATIDENNAQDLAVGAYENVKTGNAISNIASLQTVNDDQNGFPLLLNVSMVLEDSLQHVDFIANPGDTSLKAVTSV